MPQPRRYSAGALLLASRGVQQWRVAEQIGITQPSLSLILSGRRKTVRPDLYDAVRRLGGTDVADELRLILEGEPANV